jgi:hypothetical protein
VLGGASPQPREASAALVRGVPTATKAVAQNANSNPFRNQPFRICKLLQQQHPIFHPPMHRDPVSLRQIDSEKHARRAATGSTNTNHIDGFEYDLDARPEPFDD